MEEVNRPGPAGRSVESGQGVAWWSEAWALFMKNPGMWVVFGLVYLVASILLHVIPLIGSLAAALLTPVLLGGWMLSARKAEDGGTLEISDLFSGFGPLLNSLILIGAVVLVCELVIAVVVGALGLGAVGAMVGGAAYSSTASVMAGVGMGFLGMLVAMVMGLIIAIMLWFAVPLVVFDGMPPIEAMKASFDASMRNVAAFLIFGLISLVLSILAFVPFGLGWLVLLPVMFLSMYTSYRGVFGRPVAA